MMKIGFSFLVVALLHPSARAVPPGSSGGAAAAGAPAALYLRPLPLRDPLALCNDGSPAALYYRNCSANWDSKGPDYCANITNRWVLVFAGGDVRGALRGEPEGRTPPSAPPGAYCYDARSCAARARALRTSDGLPAAGLPGGLLSPYAEVNPNFYKASAALVPYCTSDLFLGNATAGALHFRGARVFDAAVSALLALPGRASLALADEVLVVGGAGVVAQLPRLRARLLATRGTRVPPLSLWGVCDGCALLADLPPPPAPLPPQCTSDADCPPHEALPRGLALWGGASGGDWRALTAPALLAAAARAGVPLLAAAQALDAVALRSYGAWGGGTNGSGAAWARATYAPALRAALRAALPPPPHGAAFVAPCSWPPALALSARAWYGEAAPCADGAGRPHNNTPAQVAAAFAACAEGAPPQFCVSCLGGGGDEAGCPFPW
jgi:hypothetical protein